LKNFFFFFLKKNNILLSKQKKNKVPFKAKMIILNWIPLILSFLLYGGIIFGIIRLMKRK
jgi:hypothetical protein